MARGARARIRSSGRVPSPRPQPLQRRAPLLPLFVLMPRRRPQTSGNLPRRCRVGLLSAGSGPSGRGSVRPGWCVAQSGGAGRGGRSRPPTGGGELRPRRRHRPPQPRPRQPCWPRADPRRRPAALRCHRPLTLPSTTAVKRPMGRFRISGSVPSVCDVRRSRIQPQHSTYNRSRTPEQLNFRPTPARHQIPQQPSLEPAPK